ncbi:MAG: SDR family oxidoreductase [Hellea sp.]|nr:SDR family oxidoreductase [Hellea sp.]
MAGGARGIGAATAKRLCEEGVKVIIGDILLDAAEETAARIMASGGDIIAIKLDGTDAVSQKTFVEAAIKAHGRLDFYHSNLAGGTGDDSNAVDITEEVLDNSLNINIKSHVLATRYAVPAMLETGGGSMIYTSSGSAISGENQRPAYAMTKNAIHALSRHVARKWGQKGIRANVICPGLIMTEAVTQFMTDKHIDGIKRHTPSHRLGQPEDIAGMVAFLASDDAAFVNGQAWHVNGGVIMRD